MSMGNDLGAFAVPGAALGMAARAVGQMIMLPWNVLAFMATGAARLAGGARQEAGGGAAASPAPPTLPTAAQGSEWTIPGAGVAGAATSFRKETVHMSMEDRCDIDDCKIKLYRYSIVSIRRGHERIVLPLDEVLVKTPLDQCDFDTWVIAKFVRKNPDVPARWLRVCSTLVCTWDKQPLHYHEKQLDYLRSIAHSVGKMQPEEDDEEPEAIEAIG